MKRNQKVQSDRVSKEKFTRVQFPVLLPKNENQKHFAEGLKYNTLVVAQGSAGTGKAQPLDSPVLTRQGWMKIGALKVGDEIMGSKTWVKVQGVFPQGLKDTVKIAFKDGSEVDCCTEHLWTVLDNKGSYRKNKAEEITITASEIAEKLKLNKGNISVPVISAVEFEEKDFYIAPYVLGALLGDGSISDTISITSTDSQILERFNKELPEGCTLGASKNITYYVNDCDSTWQKPNRVKAEIQKLGLKFKCSNNKFVPEAYKYGSVQQRFDLLQGLMDTDGTVDARNGSVSYCTVSEKLASDVREIVLSLGGKASISTAQKYFTYKGEKKKGQLAYIVSINTPDKSKLFYLDRKKNLVSTTDCTQLRRVIDSVSLIGKKDCICISVDSEDHLYATNDYVLTHNTIMACYHAAKKLHYGDVKKIVLVRAYQALAGRSIGFLPGTVDEKLQPYYQQMIDYLEDCLGKASVEIALKNKVIEICPLETIRGRSWDDAIVIVDEGQNLYVQEIQALTTRMGENCQMIIVGDNAQNDQKQGSITGLEYLEKLIAKYGITDTCFVKFTSDDVVRSGITKEFVLAYEAEVQAGSKDIISERKKNEKQSAK